MELIPHLKKQKLTIGAGAAACGALYGIAEYFTNGGDSKKAVVAIAIGGGLGALIGSAVTLGISYARGVGATPYTPIFAGLGASIILLKETHALMTGRRVTENKELIRNSLVAVAATTAGGVALDDYRGQM
jgi:hypothetical protein